MGVSIRSLVSAFKNWVKDLPRRHGAGILEVPLAQTLEQLGDTEGARALSQLAAELPSWSLKGGSLGAVLRHPHARSIVEFGFSKASRQALVDELSAWANRRSARAAEEEEAKKAAVRLAAEELEAAARAQGVERHLDDPVCMLAPFVEVDAWWIDRLAHFARGTIRDAVFGQVDVAGIKRDALAAGARRYLEACAQAQMDVARREKLFQMTPTEPTLARLASVLAAMAAEMPPPQIMTFPLAVVDSLTPAVRAYKPRTADVITLSLARHEEGLASVEPRGHRSASDLVALVRDIVHDPQHSLHRELAEALAEPGWRRYLRRFEYGSEQGSESAAKEQDRLVFRVSKGPGGAPSLDTATQRIGANGRWTKGARIEFGSALRRADLSPEEAAALRALLLSYGGYASAAEAFLALSFGKMERLVSDSGAPVSIERVEVRFALVEKDGGMQACVKFGDVPVSLEDAAMRLEGARCVAHFVDDRVLVAQVNPALSRLVRAGAGHSILLPPEATPALMTTLERVAASVPVSLPSAFEEVVQSIEPVLYVRIVPDERGAALEIRVRVSESVSAPAGEGGQLVSVLDAGTAKTVLRRRDLNREKTMANELARALGAPGSAHVWRVDDDEGLSCLLEALHHRPEIQIEWPQDVVRRRYVGEIDHRGVRVSVRSAAQWFGVDGEVEIDGETISLAELLREVRAGRRFVKVGKGRVAAIGAKLRERLVRVADVVFESGRDKLAIVPASGEVLEALADEGTLRSDTAWSRIRARLSENALGNPRVPRGLSGTLRDYQKAGFAWMARLSSVEAGAVLADDMGLGKTVQALALLLSRKSAGPALVVAPTSLGDNWAREAERFAPSLRIRVHRGAGRAALLEREPLRAGDVLVTSYDILALDIEELAEMEFATLILDEAQSIKNPDAQRTKAARRIRARARIALTGTPLENRLAELWSIVSIVHPGLLGTWEHFRGRFAIPIERDGNKERLAALATLVRPYLLRRTKEVVAPELPDRIELVREVELNEAERRLYEAERAAAIAALAAADETQRFEVLASIMRLRQIACDAALVVPDAGIESSKIQALLELIDGLRSAGRKVLVFSQFVRLLDRVASCLDEKGTRYLRLDGSTPAAARGALVTEFQTGDATAFLLSLKAGGTGLNLTSADHVVHLDPWWNPAVEDQASDRAHRIGQDKPVTIVRLVARGTIEEAVLGLHESKRALSRGVLEGADAAGALSARELMTLIRSGESVAASKPKRAARVAASS